MSYLEIVAWAALVTIGAVLILLSVSGLARAAGWHQVEGTANTLVMLAALVLISGTIVLLVVATVSYLYPL